MKKSGRFGCTVLVALALGSVPFWACSNAPQYPGGGRELSPFGNTLNGMITEGGTDAYDAKDTGIDTGVDTGTQ